MLAPTLAAARRLEVQAALAKTVACLCVASVGAVNRLRSPPLSSCSVARSVLCDANFIVRWGKGRWGTDSLFRATLPREGQMGDQFSIWSHSTTMAGSHAGGMHEHCVQTETTTAGSAGHERE